MMREHSFHHNLKQGISDWVLDIIAVFSFATLFSFGVVGMQSHFGSFCHVHPFDLSLISSSSEHVHTYATQRGITCKVDWCHKQRLSVTCAPWHRCMRGSMG